MNKIFLILPFLPVHIWSQTDYEPLVDSLKYVEKIPYIENCDDKVLWRIVDKGLDIVPLLIDKLSDETQTDNPVLFFGGKYAIADIAYVALNEIIKDIPTLDLLGVPFDAEGCGYCSYWVHLRESPDNRMKFRQAVGNWYEGNKENLHWVADTQSVTGDCFKPYGGHYELKNK